MRKTRIISLLGLAALSSACPGTLDDENFYRGSSYSANASSDAGAPAPAAEESEPSEPEAKPADAGSPSREASGLDATINDASSPWPALDAAPADAGERWPSEAAVADASAPDSAKPASDASSSAAQEAGSACDFRALIMAKCGSAGCHGVGAVATGLDLVSDNLATRLDGKNGSGACSSYALIDRDNPERSALYLKVTADSCGSRMPLGGTLSDRDQQCILQWIDAL